MKQFLSILAIVSLVFLPVTPAFADSAAWTGTTDNTWATNTNWGAAAAAPGTGETATFNGAGNGNTTIDLVGQTVGAVAFDTAAAAAYTIGAGGAGFDSLNLDNGGTITMTATVANDQTFNARVYLGDGSATTVTVTNESATDSLIFAGNMANGGAGAGDVVLAVAGAGDTTISGNLVEVAAGTLSVTKSGAGTLTLSGTNTYTGATTVNAGTLDLNSSLTTSSGIVFGGDATVTVATGANITPSITTGANNEGTLTLEGSTTVTGAVGTSGGNKLKIVNVGANGSTSVFSSTVDATTINITGDATNVTFNGDVTGTLDFDAGADPTAVTFADNADLTGAVTNSAANDGALVFAGTSTVSGQVASAGSGLTSVTAGANSEAVTFSSDVFSTTTTVSGTGTINFDGSLTGTTLNYAADGVVSLAAGENITAAITNAVTINGTLNLAGTHTLTGAIGSTGAGLKAINLNGSGATVTQAGGGAVSVQGIALGTNTLALSGTLTLPVTGTITTTVTNATTFGKITAAGAATIAAGTTVTVSVVDYIAGGSALTLVDGTGGAGVAGGLTVNDDSYVVDFVSNSAAGADLVLTAVRTNAYNKIATNTNTASVGSALEQAGIDGATGDMLTVLNTLDAMDSAAEINGALETMVPDVSSGILNASRVGTQQFMGSISNRLGFGRNGIAQSGMSTGDMIDGMGFWIQGLGSHIEQDARKGIQGYQANVFGTAVGMDKLLDSHNRMGIALGYGFADVNSKTPGSPTSDVNSIQVAVYGSYDSLDLCKARKVNKNSKTAVRNQGEDNWYIDYMLGFTENIYDDRREVWLGSTKRIAKADHYSQQYSTKVEGGYTFVFEETKNLEITPFAALAYNFLYMNDYKEKGANALNLNVDGEGYHELLQSLGTRFAYPFFSKDIGTFIPSVKAAWTFDYIADRFETTANFAGGGPSFETKGAKPAHNGLLLGAELAFLNKDNLTVTANWDWELKDEYSAHTYYGTVRLDF